MDSQSFIRNDHVTELDDVHSKLEFIANSETTKRESGLLSRIVADDDHEPSFVEKLVKSFPSDLLKELDNVDYAVNIGFFKEIDSVWVAINGRLYIWKINSDNEWQVTAPMPDNIITNVQLVAPKEGIFQPIVSHLIVITSPNHLSLFTLSTNELDSSLMMDDSIKTTNNAPPSRLSQSNSLSICNTSFNIALDQINITAVIGTLSGKIFLGANDGSIYEFKYYLKRDWYGKFCSLKPLSNTIIDMLIPGFISSLWTDNTAVEKLSYDKERHIIYILYKKNYLQTLFLGSDETQLIFSNKKCDINMLPGVQNQEILSITAISVRSNFPSLFLPISEFPIEHYAAGPHLLATTKSGARIYFRTVLCQKPNYASTSVNNNGYGSNAMGVSIISPSTSATNLSNGRISPCKTIECIYTKNSIQNDDQFSEVVTSNNVFLGISSLSQLNTIARFASSAPSSANLALYLTRMDTSGAEVYTKKKLNQVVYAIQERVSEFYSYNQINNSDEIPCNEYSSQHLASPRQFIAVTSQSVVIYELKRPVDKAFSAYSKNRLMSLLDSISDKLEVNCMLYIMAVSEFEGSSAHQRSMLYTLIYNYMNKEIISTNNLPSTSANNNSPHDYTSKFLQSDIANVVKTHSNISLKSALSFSEAELGLLLYVWRLLSPIWGTSVFTIDFKSNIVYSKIIDDQYSYIYNRLDILRKVVIDLHQHTYKYQSDFPPIHFKNMGRITQYITTIQQSIYLINQFASYIIPFLSCGDYSPTIIGLDCPEEASTLVSALAKEVLIDRPFKDILFSKIERAKLRQLVKTILLYLDNYEFRRDIEHQCPEFHNSTDELLIKIFKQCDKVIDPVTNTYSNEAFQNMVVLVESQLLKTKEALIALDYEVFANHLMFIAAKFEESNREQDTDNVMSLAFKVAVYCAQAIQTNTNMIQNNEPTPNHTSFQINQRTPQSTPFASVLSSELPSLEPIYYIMSQLFYLESEQASISLLNLPTYRIEAIRKLIISMIERCDFEGVHLLIFHFMVKLDMYEQLLCIRSIFLEPFLVKLFAETCKIVSDKHNSKIIHRQRLESLFTYYNKTKQFSNAARNLLDIGKTPFYPDTVNYISLDDRLEFFRLGMIILTSVMPYKQDTYAHDLLQLYEELEDRFIVGTIQLKLLITIEASQPHTSLAMSADTKLKMAYDLKCEILCADILYTKYATPCKDIPTMLNLLKCSVGDNEPVVISSLWDSYILQQTMLDVASLSIVKRNTAALISELMPDNYDWEIAQGSPEMIPVRTLVVSLEKIRTKYAPNDIKMTYKLLLSSGIPYSAIAKEFNALLTSESTNDTDRYNTTIAIIISFLQEWATKVLSEHAKPFSSSHCTHLSKIIEIMTTINAMPPTSSRNNLAEILAQAREAKDTCKVCTK